MVSSSADIEQFSGRGPYYYKINGQVHHRVGTLQPQQGSKPVYAQIYLYDTEEASRIRSEITENQNCDLSVMQELTDHLQQNNPFAQAFHSVKNIVNRLPHDQRETIRMIIYTERNRDQRRLNLPTANDVAAVFKADDGCLVGEQDLIIYPIAGGLQSICCQNSSLDPMAYPLLFPFGDEGWHRNMFHQTDHATAVRNKLSQLQYVAYRLAIRHGFSTLHNSQKLFLAWIVDKYTRIESERLAFIRTQQQLIRAEHYLNLHDAIQHRAENLSLHVGRQVILPKSFQGSYRNLHLNYLNAMAIVRKFGKPDIFITFTCNPNWDEIKSNLNEHQQPYMRPDLIVRVFHSKLHCLIDDIHRKQIFGKVAAIIYTIEFQKRGLPHAHILISLDIEDKLFNADVIDKVVCAEIPFVSEDSQLHELVSRHMIHEPCGNLNPQSICMNDNSCVKGFSKIFTTYTQNSINGYPVYRRRDTGITVQKNGVFVGNKFVVPYNLYLLRKYQAHINVEVCTTIKSVKYIYKYIYNGFDSASILFQNGDTLNYDEITGYLTARWIGSAEAVWRIFENEMHSQSHAVISLECHLENLQRVTFRVGEEEQDLNQRDSKLMAWFKLNQVNEIARQYRYIDIPYYYIWQTSTKSWQPRKSDANRKVTRLNAVSAKDSELYHLRLFLLHNKGARSFSELRTVDEILHQTFREAAIPLGLTTSPTHFYETLHEAANYYTPYQIRELFAILLAINVPSEPLEIWNRFKDNMIEDFIRRGFNETNVTNAALIEIEKILITHNTSCEELSLPKPLDQLSEEPVINEEDSRREFESMYQMANDEQRSIINKIISALDRSGEHSNLFYLDAPAGCGKTFVQKAIIAKITSMGRIAIPVAYTGIAVSLVKGGRTLHNHFKLPIPLLDSSVSGVKPNSFHGRYLDSVSLIIIDEASIIPATAITVIDRMIRDITTNEERRKIPFGGKIVMFSGDFRQTLPVIPHAERAVIIEHCIRSHPLWQFVVLLKLEKNMRVNEGEEEFANYLLKVRKNTLPKDENRQSILDIRLLGENSPMDFIYNNLENDIAVDAIQEKAILAPTNEIGLKINLNVLEKILGNEVTYRSIDTIISDDVNSHITFPTEFLNSIEMSGLPRHELKLTVNAIIMLMRNLNTAKGLINETRLKIINLYTNTIYCKVLTGASAGNSVVIPKLKRTPSETTLPFKMQRFQFPVTFAFAMTINKSQGQSFNKVAIYLASPVFSHGQLYVALSHARSFEEVKIFIEPSNIQRVLENSQGFTTSNIVYDEIC